MGMLQSARTKCTKWLSWYLVPHSACGINVAHWLSIISRSVYNETRICGCLCCGAYALSPHSYAVTSPESYKLFPTRIMCATSHFALMNMEDCRSIFRNFIKQNKSNCALKSTRFADISDHEFVEAGKPGNTSSTFPISSQRNCG